VTPAEREALARFGEAIRHSSITLAEGLASFGEAVVRAGEAVANLTATLQARGDEQ
jgi:hypothetical protein